MPRIHGLDDLQRSCPQKQTRPALHLHVQYISIAQHIHAYIKFLSEPVPWPLALPRQCSLKARLQGIGVCGPG